LISRDPPRPSRHAQAQGISRAEPLASLRSVQRILEALAEPFVQSTACGL
jgi:hypothetical protein